MELTSVEARVLGCLVEKQLATPQYYPLTLNALVSACNQSSNRDPVTDYDEADVAGALSALREHGLVRVVHSSSNRAPKYRHVLDETWGLDAAHRAVLAVLLLRGPQTLGEVRTRTDRMATFDSLGEVEEVLGLLEGREEPLAKRMQRQPGQKEARYAQVLCGEEPLVADAPWPARPDESRSGPPAAAVAAEQRLADLEARIERIEAELARLAEPSDDRL
jgi:uncharacterized protein